MKRAGPHRIALLGPWIVLFFAAVCLPPSGFCHPPRAPLYVFFLDQLPPQGAGPSVNGLDERRRGPVFAAALQAAAKAGDLPPVTVVNHDITLPTTRQEKPPLLPPNATLLRVYLTQWSNTSQGGFADSEILCRFFVEVVRDGRTVSKLGPYLGRTRYDTTGTATADDRYQQFGQAARAGIGQMARDLTTPGKKQP